MAWAQNIFAVANLYQVRYQLMSRAVSHAW